MPLVFNLNKILQTCLQRMKFKKKILKPAKKNKMLMNKFKALLYCSLLLQSV